MTMNGECAAEANVVDCTMQWVISCLGVATVRCAYYS